MLSRIKGEDEEAMAKGTAKIGIARLNIYAPDPAIRRQVRSAAAKRDLSVSDYCLKAITAQLVRDGELPPGEDHLHPVRVAVDRARRFQKGTFGNRVFATSSATLIRETRRWRTPR